MAIYLDQKYRYGDNNMATIMYSETQSIIEQRIFVVVKQV
jgi:hypothetical protein